MNKRGDVLLLAVFVIIIIMLILMIVDNFSYRECRSDRECGENAYCSVDHTCHNFPVIEKTVITERVSQDFMAPSIVLAFGLIIAAIIYKWKLK